MWECRFQRVIFMILSSFGRAISLVSSIATKASMAYPNSSTIL